MTRPYDLYSAARVRRDRRRVQVAAIANLVYPLAVAHHHAIGFVSVRKPRDPALAIRRNGNGGVIVRCARRRNLLLHWQTLHGCISTQERHTHAPVDLICLEGKTATGRFDPYGRRSAATDFQQQTLWNQMPIALVVVARLPEIRPRTQLILEQPDLRRKCEASISAGMVRWI